MYNDCNTNDILFWLENMINTNKFAEKHGVLPGTVRQSVSAHGHYRGITPERALNGRLLWPDVFVPRRSANDK